MSINLHLDVLAPYFLNEPDDYDGGAGRGMLLF
jgi:hypothetical protein